MKLFNALVLCTAVWCAAPNSQAQSDVPPPPPPPYDGFAEVNRTGLVTGPGWSYYGVGFYTLDQEASNPETEGSSFSIWGSEHVMDYRAGRVSLALETLGSRHQFNLSQDTISPLSDGGTYDRQRLITYGLGGQLTLRLSLEPSSRLTYERTLEGGGYFVWNYSRRLKSFIDIDPAQNQGAPENKFVQKKLAYVNPIEFGVLGRIRINRMYLWGRMRMSDFFVQQDGVNPVTNTNGETSFEQLNELERVAIGVGFCINSSN
ncbi:MAG: hypothetical protein ACON34_12740 [Flavobacteriales bacterium]